MKPDYKNWMPKGMILSGVAATIILLILFIVFGLTGIVSGSLRTALFIVFLSGTIIGVCISVWMILLYRAFSYNGKRQMSRQIIEAHGGKIWVDSKLDKGSEFTFLLTNVVKDLKEVGNVN